MTYGCEGSIACFGLVSWLDRSPALFLCQWRYHEPPASCNSRICQADALEAAGIKADVFLLLNVPDEVLIARVVGRRLDPETGDIYHLEFNPPAAEITDR